MKRLFSAIITVCFCLTSVWAEDAGIKAEFERLYENWHKESERISYSSITGDYIRLPGYRKIVALGKPALPCLQEKMRESKGLDFMLAHAVVEICGWDPKEFLGGLGEQDYCARVLNKLDKELPMSSRMTDAKLTAAIAGILTECKYIKPGSTRAELLEVFTAEGGISTKTQQTFVYRHCPYIKVDVVFRPSRDTNRIHSISKPYLEWSIVD